MHKRLWRYDMHQLEHSIREKEAVVATSRRLGKRVGAGHFILQQYEIHMRLYFDNLIRWYPIQKMPTACLKELLLKSST